MKEEEGGWTSCEGLSRRSAHVRTGSEGGEPLGQPPSFESLLGHLVDREVQRERRDVAQQDGTQACPGHQQEKSELLIQRRGWAVLEATLP